VEGEGVVEGGDGDVPAVEDGGPAVVGIKTSAVVEAPEESLAT
jgi:hypothetical protein